MLNPHSIAAKAFSQRLAGKSPFPGRIYGPPMLRQSIRLSTRILVSHGLKEGYEKG